MHLVIANSAYDLPRPSRCTHALRLARQGAKRGVGLLGVAAQGTLFFAVLWLLAAGPGFLSARDSVVPAGSDRAARQASR